MDATLLTRQRLEKLEKLEKKNRRLKEKLKEEKNKKTRDKIETENEVPALPKKPTTDLDDVIHHTVKVTKEAVPPPIILEEPEKKVVEEVVQTLEKALEAEEHPQDTVRPSDVFTYKPPKKKRHEHDSASYGSAYEELYKMLCIRMLNRFLRFFARLYRKCKTDKDCKKKLAEIPDWSPKQVKARAKEFVDSFKDIESYYKFAYAANLMLMSTIVQKSENSDDLEIEVPPFSDFVHRCYIECARAVYDNIGCLSEDFPDNKRIAVKRELLTAYGNAIATALRLLIPLDKLITIEPGENFEDADLLSEESDDEEDEALTDEESDGGSEISEDETDSDARSSGSVSSSSVSSASSSSASSSASSSSASSSSSSSSVRS